MPDVADPLEAAVRPHARGATVALRVVPRAARTELAGAYGDAVKCKVAAPPVGGAANDEVRRFVASRAGRRPGEVELLTGHRGRDKVVLVPGLSPGELRAALR